MLLADGREVVSKTFAYNVTKLSYRVEVRVNNTLDLNLLVVNEVSRDESLEYNANTPGYSQSHFSNELIDIGKMY